MTIPRQRIARCSLLAAGAVLAFCALVALASVPATAEPRADTAQRDVQPPLRIAVLDFVAENPKDDDIARGITRIIAADLGGSGLFVLIDPADFAERAVALHDTPQFPDWRATKAQALLNGGIAQQADGRLKAVFRLWDVAAGEHLVGHIYLSSPDTWRSIGHRIAEQICERLTGEKRQFQ